jgi:hypothetical protein
MFDCLAVPGVGHLQVAARGLDNRRVGVLSRRLFQRVEHLEVLTADAARVRALAAYKAFLELWKDAEPGIPIYKEARAEYAKLLSP